MSQYPPPVPPSRYLRPHRGAVILVLGIVSLVVCAPLGFVPWIMANGDLREMRSGYLDPEGEGLTNAGRILGIVACALFFIPLLIVVVVFTVMFLAGLAAAAGHG